MNEKSIRFFKLVRDFLMVYLESVHNVDTLWIDYLKNRIFAAVGEKMQGLAAK